MNQGKEIISKEEFLPIYTTAQSTKEIMDVLGISHYRATAICKGYGLEKRIGKRGAKRRVTLTEKQIQEYYVDKGTTREEAAKALGISEPTFSREMSRLFPQHKEAKKQRPITARNMLDEGHSPKYVAEKLGVCTGTIYRWQREN